MESVLLNQPPPPTQIILALLLYLHLSGFHFSGSMHLLWNNVFRLHEKLG